MSEEAPRLIGWTGERCVPWTDDVQVIYEHYHRYAIAARFVRGKRVLDLACGEGYGTALLAAHAAEVVGVDIDQTTVEHARQNYPQAVFRTADLTPAQWALAAAAGAVVVPIVAVEKWWARRVGTG